MFEVPGIDDKYRKLIPRLYTAVLCDVMDRMGLWNQIMTQSINPLDRNMRCFGRAFTVLAGEVYQDTDTPYTKEIEAVDSLSPGDVMVVTQNGCDTASFWGELLSTAAQFKGSNGIIIDGFTRDASGIIRLGFPVFAKGLTPADSRGRLEVLELEVPIRCGGVLVRPGDYIFGDIDGVCAIPKDALEETLERAMEKVLKERDARKLLEEGWTVKDIFKKFGIL